MSTPVDAAALAAVLRGRGRTNTLHDVRRAADMLEKLATDLEQERCMRITAANERGDYAAQLNAAERKLTELAGAMQRLLTEGNKLAELATANNTLARMNGAAREAAERKLTALLELIAEAEDRDNANGLTDAARAVVAGPHKCACGAVGFKPSAIPGQCEFCDGTEGGVGPTGAEP